MAGIDLRSSTSQSGASTGLTPTATVTTAYTAVANDSVQADASATLREVYDAATTNASPAVTSATAAFTSADVGKAWGSSNVGIGVTILSVQSATAATLSANATATATGLQATIGNGVLPITLPASAPAGTSVAVKKMDATSNKVTVAPAAGGDTIDGLTLVTLSAQYTARTFRKGSGTDWKVESGLTPINVGIGAQVYPLGNVINSIGDSIAPGIQTQSMIGSGSKDDYLWWAHLLSNGQLLWGKQGGIGGQRADQMVPRIERDALSQGGHFCLIHTATNDASNGTTPAAFAGYIRAMVASILARGQRPVLTTPVPNGTAATRRNMDQYRRFLISYAAANGFPLVDFYSLLVDSTTGSYLSAYDNGDGIHPNVAGKKVMGQLVVTTLQPYLIPFSPPLQMVNQAPTASNNAVPANTAIDSSSLLANGLFLTDSNADGVPDGWTKTGAGTVTVSIVTGDATIRGNALRIQDTASSAFTQCNTTNIGSSALQNHRLAFTGLVKVQGTTSTTLQCFSNGTTALNLRALNNFNTVAIGANWQKFYVEGVFPADGTTLTVSLTTGGGTNADTQVAQLGVYDLTADGL